MFWSSTNNVNLSLSSHYFAIFAYFFYRRSYFHNRLQAELDTNILIITNVTNEFISVIRVNSCIGVVFITSRDIQFFPSWRHRDSSQYAPCRQAKCEFYVYAFCRINKLKSLGLTQVLPETLSLAKIPLLLLFGKIHWIFD